jgi:hypothetical protein
MLSKANNTGSNGSVGLGSFVGGGNSTEIATLGNVAVQDAPGFAAVAPEGEQVTGAPILVLPFWNWMVPVGPCAELLLEPTAAASVTLPPPAGRTLILLATWVDVVAGEMVTESVLLLLL